MVTQQDMEAVTIAFMCDAYRNSQYSSTNTYSLKGIMTDVLESLKRGGWTPPPIKE